MLKAVRPVLYASTMYEAGEVLPATDEALVAAWVECGSAEWIDDEDAQEITARPKAKPAAALAGVTGKATPSHGPEEDLVGRVPAPKTRGAVKEPAKRPGKKSAK